MSAARAEWARMAAMRIAAAIEELARSRASMDAILAERNIYHAFWREQQERADRLERELAALRQRRGGRK